MSLALLKEIEDLKTELDQLDIKHNILIDRKVSKEIEKAQKDFKRYFEDERFLISESSFNSNRKIVAKYGQIEIAFSFSTDKKRYFGAYFIFNLEINQPSKIEYTILLNPINMRGASSNGRIEKEGEGELKNRVKYLKSEIIRTNELIEEFENNRWGLQPCIDKKTIADPLDSMYDLLKKYFD